MTALVWNDTQSYLIPSRTVQGQYQIVSRPCGASGRALHAQFIAGLGIAVDLGGACITVDEAKAVAQGHADELERQNVAAARSPVA